MNKNYVLLLAGVVLSATSSVFVRFVDVHPFAISFYRVFFAGLFWFAVTLVKDRRELFQVAMDKVGFSFLSGMFLAFYYSAWITSLGYTTVANASVLGALCPVFVAFISWILFKEKIGGRRILGIITCLAGSVLLVLSKMEFGLENMQGDLLAVLGAFFISGYYMLGGYLRKYMSMKVYVTLVYLSSALVLLILMKVSGIGVAGHGMRDTVIMISHGFACSVLGHGIYNYVLGRLSPVTLTLSALTEPVFAIIFAMVLFDETMNIVIFAGIVTILGGLLIYSLPEEKLKNLIQKNNRRAV
ncbi:Permease of the drug/metabolite transporter (DMT) superfamily [Dethiosulfatibacter aminovorans DSM 17477]|uniref:Permease of the drug/metabolite transporter (DMT) superfamily n=1 Tax=Dethiosulfatibacter aminovorans DSM 17477 TaxID=1121476 RepID=A0A1M6KJR6_9FIRM|nr:DMT family transporter [Dethiosulfatibacter aminovorans]SHJ59149.1 Permease of the drug/metabolite transporter (DMT) superfamily [Dethiosulfatibacter aminovorans DSM 17477]